ncbi:MAG: methyltransferase [Gammaproteobacteria bacterium]|nr:MAG: methyltransferase [Gammaproteobacteria bacterium]
MPIKKCRVCQQELFSEPLLQYNNMPKSAQFLPDAVEVVTEMGADIEVCQCSGCGLVQLSNEPVFYYKEVIRATAVSAEMTTFRERQFKQWIDDYSLSGKKLIEIGCGAGEFMHIMQKNDVQILGLEQGKQSVAKGIQQGLHIEQGFIEDKSVLEDGPFDAFYMLNFLEHLPNPNATLMKIGENLRDGAVGLVEVPNFDMIIRNNLFSEFISDHLFYFTRDTFISTLNRNGFDVLECQEVWHEYSISAVVRKRERLDLSSFFVMQQTLKEEICHYISQFSDNSVAIWGAGHQALAVMSLTELKGKIKYVVDSAPFKQEKFTPATHIPIVAPEVLNQDPVEAIIVMAASFSDEVANIIRQNYSGINISILRENGLDIAQ